MTGLEITEIRNNDIKKSLFEDVLFFMIAGSGAEGEAGEITFINSTGQVFHGNHVDGDIKLKKLLEAFPVLKNDSGKKPSGWHEVYLGSGNSLLVRDDVYEDFWAALNPNERNDESYRYQDWLDVALGIIQSPGNTSTMIKEVTKFEDLTPALQDLFKDIALNTTIDQILINGQPKSNDPLGPVCQTFVDYQRNDLCQGDLNLFAQEGFQIGNPWHGDAMEAPILFLGPNPHMDRRDLFPRRHAKEDIFTLGGLKDQQGQQPLLCDGVKVDNIIDIKGVYDFVANRFQKTRISANGNLCAWEIHPDNRCVGSYVLYWKNICGAMNLLLEEPTATTPQQKTRKLMRSALSAEIIPFGSKDIATLGSTQNIDYCWNRFVRPLLANCGAKILFLVGSDTTEAFCRSINLPTGTIPSGTLYSGSHTYRNRYGDVYQVASVNHFSYWRIPQNYDVVIQQLLAMKDQSPVIQKALDIAQQQYNQ